MSVPRSFTIMGPTGVSLPSVQSALVMETKLAWVNDWTIRPELEVTGGAVASGNQDLGRLEFKHRYGRTKYPWQADYAETQPINLLAPLPHWVRVRSVGQEGLVTLFVGQVADESRQPYGPDPVRCGVQVFTAYGPLWSLMQMRLDGSWWQVDGNPVIVDWTPDVNRRDRPSLRHGGVLTGNMSASRDPTKLTYLFGGQCLWTHLEFLNYLLAWHASGDGITRPKWVLAGQVELLADLDEPIELRGLETIGSLLRRVIRPDRGMDYVIVPADDDLGFQIRVFSLAAEESSYGDATLPANPDIVELTVGNSTDIARILVVDAEEQRYNRIRVRGERIVITATGRFADNTLAPKWSEAQETAYKAGTGRPADLGQEHDAARGAEWLKPVYQAFGLPSGASLGIPVLEKDGTLRVGAWRTGQSAARETLAWLPLFDDKNYATSPPTPVNTASADPKLQSANAWLRDEDQGRYVSAETAQVSVSVARSDWGVMLGTSPNHRLALNHFAGAADTDVDPVYDYERIVVTYALRTDYRIQTVWEAAFALDTDPTMVIDVPDAEFWYVKAGTAIDLNADGTFRVAAEQVTRNDRPALEAVMASAIARYARPRGRAEIVFYGVLPWTDLLGQVLKTVDEGGEIHDVRAPITSLHWMIPDMQAGDGAPAPPQTIVRAGHATG